MKIKAAKLIEDFSIYPRSKVDSQHVAELVERLEVGEKLPSPVIDKKSLRIVDGVHRCRAYLRRDPQAEIDVEVREYADEREMYLDAMRLNSRHGKAIVGSEITHAIIRAQELKIDNDQTAMALGITADRILKIMQLRVAEIRPSHQSQPIAKVSNHRGSSRYVVLKQSLHHLAKDKTRVLTKSEARAAESASGTAQWLLLRQVRQLIEHNFLDLQNARVKEEFGKLAAVIANMGKRKAS